MATPLCHLTAFKYRGGTLGLNDILYRINSVSYRLVCSWRYVMYFRVYRWRRVFISWDQWAESSM